MDALEVKKIFHWTVRHEEAIMTDLDPQTTADFWDAYLRAGTNSAQVGDTFLSALHVPVSDSPRITSAAITFAWDRVLVSAPIGTGARPRAA